MKTGNELHSQNCALNDANSSRKIKYFNLFGERFFTAVFRQSKSDFSNQYFKSGYVAVGVLLLITLIVTLLPLQLAAESKSKQTSERMYTINYYPKDYPWLDFWVAWDSFVKTVMDEDLDKLQALGFNTVRIFVNPGIFDSGNADAYRKLEEAVALIDQHGMKAHINLFDCSYDWQNIPGSKVWVDTLVTPLQDDERIAVWELVNEAILFDEVGTPDADVQNWVMEMFTYLQANAGDTPTTISISYHHAEQRLDEWLDALLDLTKDDPMDILSIHWYPGAFRDVSKVGQVLRQVEFAISSKNPNAELMLGESGANTFAFSEAAQSRLIYDVLHFSNIASEPHLGIWNMYDFPDGTAQCDPMTMASQEELHFGIYEEDISAKPATAVLQNAFLNDTFPSHPLTPEILNDSFEQLNPNSMVVDDWTSWNETWSSDQTFMQDCTVAHSGNCSAKIIDFDIGDASNKEVVGIRAFPGFSTDCRFDYGLSGYVQTDGLDGWAQITISWYQSDDTWLGNSTSNQVTAATTSGWEAVTLAVTESPPNAAYFIVFAQARSEASDAMVWFDDIQLELSPTSCLNYLPSLTRN